MATLPSPAQVLEIQAQKLLKERGVEVVDASEMSDSSNDIQLHLSTGQEGVLFSSSKDGSELFVRRFTDKSKSTELTEGIEDLLVSTVGYCIEHNYRTDLKLPESDKPFRIFSEDKELNTAAARLAKKYPQSAPSLSEANMACIE